MFARRVSASSGFTLVELVLVISITITLAAIATPFMTAADPLSTAAAAVADDVAASRLTAMRSGKPVTISIAAGSANYSVDGVAKNISCFGSGVTISSGSSITFNSLGEPKGAVSASIITIAAGGKTKTVTVQPYTGLVSTP